MAVSTPLCGHVPLSTHFIQLNWLADAPSPPVSEASGDKDEGDKGDGSRPPLAIVPARAEPSNEPAGMQCFCPPAGSG